MASPIPKVLNIAYSMFYDKLKVDRYNTDIETHMNQFDMSRVFTTNLKANPIGKTLMGESGIGN